MAILTHPTHRALCQKPGEVSADKIFIFQRTEEEYNKRLFNNYQEYQESLNDRGQEIKDRRLPGDDLYLPIGIN